MQRIKDIVVEEKNIICSLTEIFYLDPMVDLFQMRILITHSEISITKENN
jgi:hypothetical protein